MALLAPWISPTDPTDLSLYNLLDAELPPSFMADGDPRFLLGTDNQGRDLLSAILYGARVSIAIGGGAVLVAATVGVLLGLVAGYFGGWIDALIMRDRRRHPQPADHPARSAGQRHRPRRVSRRRHGDLGAGHPHRGHLDPRMGAVCAHRPRRHDGRASKDYVKAAKVIGLPSRRIMLRHILPNVMAPVLVIATINLAAAVLTEATLSFLGVGMPPTYPSLGTLIRIGNEFVFSGIWWIALFPAITLVILVLSVNVVGDWLRDRFNPKLRGH